MKMVSPMQRYVSHVKAKDADGNDIEVDEDAETPDFNPKL
jgi:hypothetical protein